MTAGCGGMNLNDQIGIIVKTFAGPSVALQDATLAPRCTYLLTLENPTVSKIGEKLIGANRPLDTGDVIALYSAAAFPAPMGMLIKFINDAHKRGVAVLFAEQNLLLDSATLSHDLAAFLSTLAEHNRSQIAERLSRAAREGKPSGRPRTLSDQQIAQLETELAKPKANIAALARSMGVARVTLYRYIQRISERGEA